MEAVTANEPLGNSTEHREESVDHIVLTHEYRTEQIGHNDKAKLLGIRATTSKDGNQNSHIDHEDDSKETTVQRENLVAQVADNPPLRLFWNRIVLVPIPCVALLHSGVRFGGDISR